MNANQVRQRQKGYIDEAYRSALQRQQVKEGDVRQGTAESLASRGLLTTGAVRPNASKIAQAMGTPQTGAIAPSRSLGARAQNENSREFSLERYDLSSARNQAQRENKADALNEQISSIANGATGIAQAYGIAQLGKPAAPQAAPGPSVDAAQQQQLDAISAQPLPGVQVTPSKIYNAMSVDNPGNWFGGVHGIRPLDAPGSSWNTKETVNGRPGTPNSDFHL